VKLPRTTRERGGVFLFAALVMALIVLMSAGMLTEASRNMLLLAGGHERRQALREGAFAGVRWAALRAPATAKPQGTLRLTTCKVAVETSERSEGRLRLRVVATNQIGERLTLDATLAPDAGQRAWQLVDYGITR